MKKLLFATATIAFFVATTTAQQDATYTTKLIKSFEHVKMINKTKQGRRSITPYIAEARNNWDKLTCQGKSYFQPFMTRPVLTNEQVLSTADIDIHYTTDGANAIADSSDADNNGKPDYVENMLAVFDTVYNAIKTQGYNEPPADSGMGGNNKYDVYIFDVDGFFGSTVYGFVSPETAIGDNPKSSPLVELYAKTSWMGMRREYTSLGGNDALTVTAAHELSHSFDFGYNGNLSFFFLEAKGPWAEQKLYPANPDDFQYLSEILNRPDVALTWDKAQDGVAYDGHWYGAWIFNKYLTERTNDDIIRKVLAKAYDCTTISCELAAYSSELTLSPLSLDVGSFFVQWLVANLFLTNNASFAPYTYSNATAYSNYLISKGFVGKTKFEDSLDYTGRNTVVFDSDIQGNKRLQRLSADYFQIKSTKNFSVKVTRDNFTDDVGATLVKYINAGGYNIPVPSFSGNDYLYTVNDNSNNSSYGLIVWRNSSTVTDTVSKHYTVAVSEFTGIAEKFISQTISVYPLPSADVITVERASSSSAAQVEISNLLGEILCRTTLPQGKNKNTIDVRNLHNGVYFLTAKEKNNEISRMKIVVSR